MKRVTWCCWRLLLGAVTVTSGWAADWPHYLGPTYDLKPSINEFTARSATELWNAKVNTGMCSVTVANGLLYTMGNDEPHAGKDKGKDTVTCLDARTGQEKWTFSYSCQLDPRLHPGGPSATPTIHQGKVYTLSKFGHIFCLDATTGEKLWAFSAVHYKPKKPWWGFAASPTLVGDVVIFNVGDRGLGLNKDTGDIVWKSEKNVVGYATPKPLPARLFDRPAVALLTNEAFQVLDPATGDAIATYSKTWEEKSNCNAVTPYLHRDHVFLVHSKHGLARLSLDGNRFKQDWLSEDAMYPNEWFAFNTHVIYGDHIYFLTKDRKPEGTGLCCVEAKTGQRKFFDTQYGFGNAMQVGATMIMLSEEGELIWGRLGQASFQETHRQKILNGLCWATPVLLENRLYARDAEGQLVCLMLE